MDDAIQQMAKEIVDGHNIKDSAVYEDMVKEISVAILKHVNAELIARMNDKQVEDFVKLLDKKPNDQQIVEYVKNCGIDIIDAVSTALRLFRESYYANG